MMRNMMNLARVGQNRILLTGAPRTAGNLAKPTIFKGIGPSAPRITARSLFAPRVLGGVLPGRLDSAVAWSQALEKKEGQAGALRYMDAKEQRGGTDFLGKEMMAQLDKEMKEAKPVSIATEQSTAGSLAKNGMVFEIGITFLVSHYVHIFISLARCLFQVFRPILIAFIFGQILKAVFFAAGIPIWFSFYSIWMFEVFYGLLQCIISFIFVCFFYNNLSFQNVRPLLHNLRSQGRLGLQTAMRTATMAQKEKSPVARVLPYLKPTA